MDWSVITGQSIGAAGGAIASWLITWLVTRRRTQHRFRFEYDYNQEQEPVFQEAREIPQGYQALRGFQPFAPAGELPDNPDGLGSPTRSLDEPEGESGNNTDSGGVSSEAGLLEDLVLAATEVRFLLEPAEEERPPPLEWLADHACQTPVVSLLDQDSQTNTSSLSNSDRGVQSVTTSEDRETQSCEVQADCAVQAVVLTRDAAVETIASFVEFQWARLYRKLRRLSFLRRLRPNITEFVRGFDGVYPAARIASATNSSISGSASSSTGSVPAIVLER